MGEGKNSYSPADKEEREQMMPPFSPAKGPEVAEGEEDPTALKPKLSLLNGVTVIVGSIIGSGIFISPTGVLKGTGSSGMAIVLWTVCGIFSTIGAYCYCELGCMITKSGADYAYIMGAFGPFCGFLRLWVECMIVRPASQAIVALTFAIYALRPFYEDCDSPEDAQRLLAASCIFVLTIINCYDVKWATRVQDVTTFAKVLALVIIIIAGAYQLCMGHFEHFTFENTETDVTKISLAAYAGLFAYNGWNYLNYIIEELKDPVVNLPRAVAISCALVTICYVFTNIAFFTTMSAEEMLASEAVAVTFANKLFGPFAFTIPIFVALSTFGAVNGVLLTSSRLFYCGAREGQMPEILTHVQVTRITPAPAVLFQALLSLLFLTSSNVFQLVNMMGIAVWLAIGCSILVIPWLRWKDPDAIRPIKVNMIWVAIYLAGSVFVCTVPFLAAPFDTLMGLCIILTGIPVYFVFVYWKKKPAAFDSMMKHFTWTLQKLMVVVPPLQDKKAAVPEE